MHLAVTLGATGREGDVEATSAKGIITFDTADIDFVGIATPVTGMKVRLVAL